MNATTIATKIQNTSLKRGFEGIGDSNKVLCITSMKNGVIYNDIRRHFVGCIKVILKRSQLPPYLKYVSSYSLFYFNSYSSPSYAFVYYRTCSEAEYHRKQPVDHHVFGSNCRVEYANNDLHISNKEQISEMWNIIIRHIPENITEECLRNLFPDCYSMKYIPARAVDNRQTGIQSTTEKKILWG
jgi:hypothetical protein